MDTRRLPFHLRSTTREAIVLLEHAQHAPPLEAIHDGEEAGRLVARMRDGLIERLRAEKDEQVRARLRRTLNQLNAALSFVAAIEFPLSATRRGPIERARSMLAELEGNLSQEA